MHVLLLPGGHGPALEGHAGREVARRHSKAIELGYQEPRSLEEWGTIGEYHLDESWSGKIPPEVRHRRRLYEHFLTLRLGLARGRIGWWERRAAQRLVEDDSRGGRLEAKAFDLFHRLTRRFDFSQRELRPGHVTAVRSGRG